MSIHVLFKNFNRRCCPIVSWIGGFPFNRKISLIIRLNNLSAAITAPHAFSLKIKWLFRELSSVTTH